MFASMAAFSLPGMVLLALGHELVRLIPMSQAEELNPPCSDFSVSPHPSSAWTIDDCIDVWAQFDATVLPPFRHRMPDLDTWGTTGLDLRQAGSPCGVKSTFATDGVGSTTIRNLATWIFAEEMGCDWITPRGSGRTIVEGNTTTTLYCHRIDTKEEYNVARKDMAKFRASLRMTNHCSVVDWLSYFQFDASAVTWAETGELKVIQARY